MRFLPQEEIVVKEQRVRRVFTPEKLAELGESITRNGLIHLPVVRQEDGKFVLASGERRLRTMKQLHKEGKPFCYLHTPVPVGQIPVALFEELDEIAALEIELDENIKRDDITWQEKAEGIKRLHELRQMRNPSQTMADTMEEISGRRTGATEGVRDQILLAQNLERPAVAKAATPKEAMKALRRELELEFRAKLGEAVVGNISKKLHLAKVEAEVILPKIPAEQFDVVLTDPPYGIDADKIDAEMLVSHTYKDDWESVSQLMDQIAPELYRVARPQAHLYMFCDLLRFFDLKQLFEEAGWKVWPRPMIWYKDVGHIPDPNHGPKRVYECILFGNKGNKPVTALYDDVIQIPAVKKKSHAAEKPVALYENLLRRSMHPGAKVVDPFCGSGPIFEACHNLQLEAFGFDKDPASVSYSEERIKRILDGKEK